MMKINSFLVILILYTDTYLCWIRGSVEDKEDPRCFTPDGKLGICNRLNSCPALMNLLNKSNSLENQNYVNSSRCEGPFEFSVCCGPPVDPVFEPISDCQSFAAPPDLRTECCGIEGLSANKIYGGKATAIDQYPWLALIEYVSKKNESKKLCGGSLVSSKYVLTAAHCVHKRILHIATPTNVHLGEYDLSSNGPDCTIVAGGGRDCTPGTTIIPIETITMHKGYSKIRRHDIALIRLRYNAPYSDFIRPICLPRSDVTAAQQLEEDLTFYVAGWGRVSATHKKSDIKLHVDVPYRTLQECQSSYYGRLWEGQICAGGISGKDSCKGDSGGPLMYEQDGIFTIVGVVSFGHSQCGMRNVPAVYTKMFHYLPWIRTHIKP